MSYRMPRAQTGAFAPMFALLLLVILGFSGLAIDTAAIYNRKAELHGVAATIALAAARELDGTSPGIDAALAKAAETAARLRYRYVSRFPWSDSAITFSNAPAAGADWVAADTAKSHPAAEFYVKVDTRELAPEVGLVDVYVMPLLAGATPQVSTGNMAIAGRSSIHVLPLAICAMSPDAARARSNVGPPATVELVEYGFRRGVSYNLMRLNPDGTDPVNFALDPLTPPGGLGAAANTSTAAIEQFVCTGRLWMPRVTGDAIRVASPFPIASLHRQLNSRFDQYDGNICRPNGAPPDFNVKAYTPGASGGASWMSPRPTRQSARENDAAGRLQTIADLPTPPAGTSADMYGPLWAYARAVKFSAYTPGSPEPANGYARFSTSDWTSLYPATTPPATSGYPSSTQPYQPETGAHYAAPTTLRLPISVIDRRVLHIPLLACPVPAGSNVGATVLAVAKFFMTAPADPGNVHAEFGGIIPENKLAGEVTLYP